MSEFRRRLMIMESNKNYITDGIVAWWDGIWNAGMNTHSSDTTTWVDLSGNSRDMTLTQSSWDSESFVVLQSTQNKATIPSVLSFVTLEFVFKLDWAYNSQYGECSMLSGVGGFGLYTSYPFRENSQAFYFTDNSSSATNKKRFRFYMTQPNGIQSIKSSVQYIIGGTSQDSLSDWKGLYNGVEYDMSYQATGISSSGVGINQRSDRRFAGNVYALRMYDRALSDSELMHNLKIDNQRFNLGLTL